MINIKEYSDTWASDIDKNVLTNGEIYDKDVINQSITNIISTSTGERIFNLSFGSGLSRYLFENITESTGEKILDVVIDAIEKWEDRITVLESDCRLQVDADSNTITINIPYIIKQTNVKNVFKKKIINV